MKKGRGINREFYTLQHKCKCLCKMDSPFDASRRYLACSYVQERVFRWMHWRKLRKTPQVLVRPRKLETRFLAHCQVSCGLQTRASERKEIKSLLYVWFWGGGVSTSLKGFWAHCNVSRSEEIRSKQKRKFLRSEFPVSTRTGAKTRLDVFWRSELSASVEINVLDINERIEWSHQKFHLMIYKTPNYWMVNHLKWHEI